ncbi:HigA family addiction module antitoxin [Mesorhizobium sp. VK23B]|uniref:HigA family addiction module antitoxin n=1 Tax=Mesorhizobium dulcispinae TaxID=3072316 RepID=A0ABU4XQU8_9HYPH|nr:MULTISPECIES: HigA family addiction module antitoxin [unclassified Mesorhizobium]MDX8470322.1 HigA family addiction module antitoxin [Mesorhizobium sp. VK23B]MDX8476691.1 HigA family addiction module antitoxin [Mesorhizobium sp. VK23A]
MIEQSKKFVVCCVTQYDLIECGMKKPVSTPLPMHPGLYVRVNILSPKKISVTAAANLVGVSRPNLSNFLNGKLTTTPEMAQRIERAFGLSAQMLLDMQAMFDAAEAKSKGTPSSVKAYVPAFLQIKANDIEAWADGTISRFRFAVFLRTLINSSGVGLTKVDFGGNDDAERPGWDGVVEASAGTPWIAAGRSGWEFGVNKDIKKKADDDFAKSVKAHPDKDERADITFVFVTPRRWHAKRQWIADAKAKKLWKDVVAFDSSDLEQWVEQSLAAQAWFANETHRPSNDVRSLDKCWSQWANVTKPMLVGNLFKPAIEASRRTLESRLTKAPIGPTIIAADSTEEALAFLSQAFGHSGIQSLDELRDRVLVFDKPGVLPKLAEGARNFIAVATSPEVERELAPLTHDVHTIVLAPRNSMTEDPHVVLEPVSGEGFRAALEEMGFERDDIERLSDESGRSLTVLRRRLATVPSLKAPEWASDNQKAGALVPFLFAGSWGARNVADQTALSLLSGGTDYSHLEKSFQQLTAINGSPVWSIGDARGTISSIDLLFAIAGSVTAADIDRFFAVAEMVLGEDDPSLDLPEHQRWWSAAFHGKSREFSSSFRRGIAEALVLLAVHGKHLFFSRLGVDTEQLAARLVRTLLTPLTTRKLEANDRDLPTYAEVSPEEFLAILHRDLKELEPAVLGLMRPASSEFFAGGPARSGLLWALEGLAWSPKTLGSTALILARLAEIEVKDNWSNKPITSLEAIFCVWMPQTAASHDERLRVLRLLKDRHPKVAWQVCVSQLDQGQKIGHYSHKPRFRPDGYGFGEPFRTWAPITAFIREIAEMVLTWPNPTSAMVVDLVGHLHAFSDDDQKRVWQVVETWAASGISDQEKLVLREKIRVTVLSRRGVRRSRERGRFATLTAAARKAYSALEPNDLLDKHAWLFKEQWVEESADELNQDEIDFRAREERIASQRLDALREILVQRGIEGVIELSKKGNASWVIGRLLGPVLLESGKFIETILLALPSADSPGEWQRKNLVAGLLRSTGEACSTKKLLELKEKLDKDAFVRVLLLAPYRKNIWDLVDQLGDDRKAIYWDNVVPDWIFDAEDENRESVDRLLAAKRPTAAFAAIHFKQDVIGPDKLFRVLESMVTENKEQTGNYQLQQHDIETAFSILNKCPDFTLEQKAVLEFAYIDVLSQPWREGERGGIPNLEKYVEQHPEFFVQAIVWAYKRKSGVDPEEWRVPPERLAQLAQKGHKLLDGIKRMPGQNDLGVLDYDRLSKWVQTVLSKCAELSRLEIGNLCVGKLFAHAPVGADGVWPCEPVRQVIEDIQSEDMESGAHTGLYNSRGVHWRGEGGDQERELASKYRAWAEALQYSHPFVSSKLLMGMVRTYEYEAGQQDTAAGVRRRMR